MKCVRSQTRDDRAPSRFSRRPWKMSLPHFSHLLYIFTLEDDGAIGAQRSRKKDDIFGLFRGGLIFFGWFCARDSNFGQQQNNKKHITHSSATERRASNANKRRRWLILSAEFFSFASNVCSIIQLCSAFLLFPPLAHSTHARRVRFSEFKLKPKEEKRDAPDGWRRAGIKMRRKNICE